MEVIENRIEKSGFKFEKQYIKEGKTINRFKKGLLKVDFVYSSNKFQNLDSIDVFIKETSCKGMNIHKVLVLDLLINDDIVESDPTEFDKNIDKALNYNHKGG